ncbi:23S rRNA (adenine(2030)-N(6))-methyltransferase RlmJ [Jannaschia rubra]|uniref:Ribosomal RNA large subunit methyltransferase J n=1 Tax=Jannaschia rubra TaxID=282197 RepID=A0A0M6XM64_9RHOB|nr:23S rRNA (adenine(2030)-N(6))-methyltransferase RlmJ [Jannaschia rubra]CTQ31647.1 Ribosomal RNA large subunit methyltransferase J [Jannaschia rubra]SFF75738.1 23S rRNA (adenine2030-N6)-methyltransferase [Jannaschia rubra]
MLSYQHGYHAGNAADVHKHALLSWTLAYMVRKDKAISYLETHAGRGAYDLDGPAAAVTGEARTGVDRLLHRFPPDHPYVAALTRFRAENGARSYPGSPLLAALTLRPFDKIDLAELHPAEHGALIEAMPAGPNTRIHRRDGLEMAKALTPPDPRRGLMLIDPSWEVKADYTRLATLLPVIHRKWGVGVLMLWYPILPDRRHLPMTRTLRDAMPEALVHEVRFPPARPGHGMEGSGMVVVNPPWGMEGEMARLSRIFEEAADG